MKKFTAQDYQMQTYGGGLQGKRPLLSPLWKKMEEEAYAKMEEGARSYIHGGAGLSHTVNNNRNDFNKYRIVPRMLKNVDLRDTSTKVLGVDMTAPFFLCPVGVAEMVNPEGDLAIAKGAAPTGIPYIFSNQGSFPMEDCAAAMGETPYFFQLYWSKSRALVSSFVKRAESSGARGIVLTLDTTLLGWRTGDMDIAYLPFLLGKGIAQYTSDPVFRGLVEDEIAQEHPNLDKKSPEYKTVFDQNCAILFTKIYNNSTTTWDDLAFLRDQTSLPIILKGILHKDDAQLAVKYGMDAIYVSNHGGRQVDGSISSIAALPKIVKVVKKKIPIMMDSGIRGGADVFKALALGANAVGLGRPHIFALTLAGAEGVTEVIHQLKADFELTMALSGCKNVAEINRACLVKA